MPVADLHPGEEIIGLVKRKVREKTDSEDPKVVEWAALGFEYRLLQLYERFQQGEISLEYLAEQLGLNIWEAHSILDRRGLRTSNL